MERICPICEISFEAVMPCERYCSERCRNVGHEITQIKALRKRQRERIKKKPGYSKICEVCGKAFTGKSANAKYCSEKCRKERNKKARLAKIACKSLVNCVEHIPKTKPVYKIGKKLEDMTERQLLDYGKLSYQKQIEAMRKQQRTV